ncbi:DUF2236 domain-containing protein [Streptomyces tricolor]|nr:DUF2236 domain-containing protein [Streptomyces tricolor]
MADPGLFTPASVTWQLHGDPMMWVAGVRALYLQALHPRAVRGVMQNSDFRRDAWGRLMRTAHFVGTTTYGTTEAAERAGARVRKIHSMLTVTDPDTGERYGVDEPELLRWVHCAEIDSLSARPAPLPASRSPTPRRTGTSPNSASAPGWWGLDPETVPAGRAELAAYFEAVRPRLAAGPRRARWTTSCSARPRTPPPRPGPGNCCGGGWRCWPTPRCRRTPTSCTADRPPAPAAVTRRLRTTGALLRRIPARLRWQLPPQHILRAMARLGPHARPAPEKLGP